jgi:hypothetical protein
MPEILTTNSVMLPRTKTEATRIAPKILLIYGLPKIGKTGKAVELDDALLIDAEDGSGSYEALRVQPGNMSDLYTIVNEINAEGKARYEKGMRGDDLFPYKYGILDTLDKVEEWAEIYATAKYKKSPLGKDFKGSTILELGHGLGYFYLREEMLAIISKLASVFKHLILIVHVKEKLLDKKGEQVKVNDISLTGRLGAIVCSKADAIGFVYREADQLMISFDTGTDQIMGARFKHLAGKKMPFEWDSIYKPQIEA